MAAHCRHHGVDLFTRRISCAVTVAMLGMVLTIWPSPPPSPPVASARQAMPLHPYPHTYLRHLSTLTDTALGCVATMSRMVLSRTATHSLHPRPLLLPPPQLRLLCPSMRALTYHQIHSLFCISTRALLSSPLTSLLTLFTNTLRVISWFTSLGEQKRMADRSETQLTQDTFWPCEQTLTASLLR